MSSRPWSAPAIGFFLLFTVSGFAGLIYQSIWSHYLKLFLGHAAYAQTLVLAMFMGGMAAGAWLCAKFALRINNPLRGYAIAEFIIGLLALVFHFVFTRLLEFSYGTAFPSLGSTTAIDIYKWVLAGLLILPQSVLLGTTFPLMSAGVLRRFPQTPGSTISLLYFTNSLGAAVGVLASGFYLIGKFGLPGTLMTAGLLNIGLAIVMWAASKSPEATAPLPANTGTDSAEEQTPDKRFLTILLVVALATGAASFAYEIAWIRMLSLVLGSSTHAFEIMLSALILGIAFGSLWIRRRIDVYTDLLTVLGIVLVIKGLMAVATIPLYGGTFEAMQTALQSLNRSEPSYVAFNAFSHAISLAVMFPSAFFAGMSLPLITCILLRRGFGEAAIGNVYSWNTVGAIFGVVLAVHIGLGMLGLKHLIVAAALVDVGIALSLLAYAGSKRRSWALPAAGLVSVTAFATVLSVVHLDPVKMASGVYRDGKLFDSEQTKIAFSKDGKSATINVLQHADGTVSISTNGKTDAALRTSASGPPESDEYTMVLASALPLAYRPDAKLIANIGFGSGLTSHAVLGSPTVTHVDNIEIEPAMIEGARLFGRLTERAYNDQRSHFHIDDAKSFFAAQQKKYDVIISEPSNPWVSGVAGLFSREFYQRVRTHLADDGLLVQWIQLYEIDTALVASILKSLGDHFSDYVAFEISGSDMLVLAVPNGTVGEMSEKLFSMPLVAADLAKLNITQLTDISMRRIGNKALLDPMLRSYPIAANSDFYPIVDLNAAKARFLLKKATELPSLNIGMLPVTDIIEKRQFPNLDEKSLEPSQFELPLRHGQAKIAARVRAYILSGVNSVNGANLPAWQFKVSYFSNRLTSCDGIENDSTWSSQLREVGKLISAYTPPKQAADVWRHIESAKCADRMSPDDKRWLGLFRAISERRPDGIADSAGQLLDSGKSLSPADKTYLVHSSMAANIARGTPNQAAALWSKHGTYLASSDNIDVTTRMLVTQISR
jgi:predicted membrane-bound spermidine synthase